MGERLSVVEGELTTVEEVAGRLNDFVTNDGKEVPDLDRQVSDRNFAIQLRNRATVRSSIVPIVVPMPRICDTKCLSVRTICTVDVIDASAETDTFATVRYFFSEEPLLAELNVRFGA